MKHSRVLLLAAILVVSVLVSSAAILAQDATPESTAVPSSFNDGRTNGDIQLGGLAIYCTDASGSAHTNTFQDGGIQVWGVGGQEYITLTAAQLRGNEEIVQPPPTMEAGATEEPTAAPVAGATEEVSMAKPVLLAQADTPNGTVWFFRTGDDQFVLQGTDENSKFFTYLWTGCNIGSIRTDVNPLMPDMQPMPVMSSTEEMTPEATASS